MFTPMKPAQSILVAMLAVLPLAGCRVEPRPVGVLVSRGIDTAATLAAAAAGPGAIELRVEWPASAVGAQAALDVAEKLVDEGAIAVVGHSNSAASLAASQAYNRARVVQLAPTTTATVYEHAGEYSFRMVPSDRDQARLLVRAARQLAGGRPVVVMYENDAYGYGLHRDLEHAARSQAVSFAAAAAYLSDEPPAAVRAVFARLLERRPGVLIWLGRGIPLDAIYAQARAAGVKVIASDGLDAKRTYANDGDVFTGLYFVRLLDPAVQERAARALAGRLDVAAVGAEGLLTYDAVGVIRAAVAEGARDGSDVRAYLLSLGRTRPPYDGVTGEIHFDENRSLQRAWQLAMVTGSAVVPVEVAP